MFYEVPRTTIASIFKSFLFPSRRALNFSLKDSWFTIPTSSGKAAIHLILEWLHHTGVLKSRMDEILVPQWMGAWVYKTIQSLAFPQTVLTPNTKVIWAYHQYGFPQDMDAIMKTARDRGLVVVEDCAHAIDSKYNSSRVGTIGDFGVFSFSKFIPSLMGGAISTNNKDARDFFLNRIRNSRTLYAPFCFWSKYFDERTNHSKFAQELLKTSYALYPHHVSMTKTVQNLVVGKLDSLKRRIENYDAVKRVLKGNQWIDSLEKDALPYVVPIYGAVDQLQQIVKVIKAANLYSGIYHFDKNRNVLDPQLVQVAWLPIHQGISKDIIEKVSADIKTCL